MLIEHHDPNALIEAARRTDLMLERGVPDGRIAWIRIRRAIAELRAPLAGRLR
jgi:hypothetical protein